MSAKTSTKTSKAVKTQLAKAELVPEQTQTPPPTPVEANVELPTETVEAAETLETGTTMRQRFEVLIKARQDQLLELKREVQELRKMQRDHENAIKDASKKSKKKKAPRDEANPRKPSGFASPVVVSDELYAFLEHFGVKSGEPVARTDVTRHITTYIKEHDLQNPEHRREIIPDATLHKLFGAPVEPKDPNDPDSQKIYTYLRLQRYLSPHFPKKQQ
jgi:upstream activation factor subunit UAF30